MTKEIDEEKKVVGGDKPINPIKTSSDSENFGNLYKYSAKVLRVIDGDTIEVQIDLGLNIFKTEIVRLARIDAYEVRLGKNTSQKEKEIGLKAKDFLKKVLLNRDVILSTHKEKGKFGRYIADVTYISDSVVINLNDLLVEKKYAVYKSY